ncbi:MAG: NADPH-dependent 2,4-dienoyl-CoA reductase, partial [Polaromonas sp.]|nr:NADPH-dependent 2,4-dienoyl-CoA reductase [Polaromonas sp.]
SNRLNMPEVAEQALLDGCADMVSMARPFLADPEFVNKAAQGRSQDINTCIACNQACLDHAFKARLASCLVNPRAGHETELVIRIAPARKRLAVVGAGPAGLAAATTLAGRGHDVTLFDAAGQIGGQFNLARRVPGKEEFAETLRYFGRRIEQTGVTLRLNTRVEAADLVLERFDEVVLATGVTPRNPRIPGQAHPRVLSYIDVLLGRQVVGERVALIGAGGIGFDVAEFLVTPAGHSTALDLPAWLAEWGVADPGSVRGGVVRPQITPSARQVTLLQRKAGKMGAGLGKTTGWIHRAALKMKNVEMRSGVNYERIGDHGAGVGLFITHGPKRENADVIEVDHIVLCAGQEPLRELLEPLRAAGMKTHLIGGADEAGELDAKRAIDQGTRLAASL